MAVLKFGDWDDLSAVPGAGYQAKTSSLAGPKPTNIRSRDHSWALEPESTWPSLDKSDRPLSFYCIPLLLKVQGGKMKTILLLLLCLVCVQAKAGYFVEKSMYSPKYLAVGQGVSLEGAYKDAMSAMPKEKDSVHFEVDPSYSPSSKCTGGGAPDSDLKTCGSAEWQTAVPLIRIER